MIETYVNNKLNEELFTLSNFPAGEPHAKLNRTAANIGDKIDIILKGADLNEYAQVLMMINLLKQYNVEPRIFVPYLGGARADKDATRGWEPYAMFLRQYPRVTVADIHSTKHVDFFKAIDIIRPVDIIPNEIVAKYDVIVAPDQGAVGRATSVAGLSKKIAVMQKERDQDTGRILNYDFDPYRPRPFLSRKKLLVVDDICDGGMTFKFLAETLKAYDVAQLDLYVTHGVFSGNAKENLAAYDTIYTTNSLESAKNVDAHIIDLGRIYLEDSSTISN